MDGKNPEPTDEHNGNADGWGSHLAQPDSFQGPLYTGQPGGTPPGAGASSSALLQGLVSFLCLCQQSDVSAF